ncbi:hypothetical protein D8B22_18520 [Verminephrobacter aporrectodeae subsp. tuberculatae]|nr:hypothetical protein [Verminephrobacter aporrectodeae subsp. tuberculatae]MCW8171052.1 hypothetical protein [Verminephrobacter aporrectodeae subsp. tuberculatae]
MPHRPPTACRATPLRTRFLPWLPACFLGLALAAYGAGNTPGSGGGAVDPRTTGTFIAPAGPLCAKRNTSSHNCIQPTSSSTNELALFEAITDPGGSMIDFDSPGFIANVLGAVGEGGRTNGPTTTPSYGMARRHVQAGRNSFIVNGRHYGDGEPDRGMPSIHYKGHPSGNASFSFRERDLHERQEGHKADVAWSFLLAEFQDVTRGGPSMAATWYAKFGLLTDYADAPTVRKVRYVGYVTAFSGTGEQLGERGRDALGTAGAIYETELDTVTGRLAGARIDYTSPKNQMRTRLELPDLEFRNSRLNGASREQRITVHNEGFADALSGKEPQPDSLRIQHSFTLDGLEGEIMGKQAAAIHLVGGGPKGILRVRLVRRDLGRYAGMDILDYWSDP